jgi:ABC-type transport system involved in multi-copper enzyme maturation permease subunit
MSQITLQVEEKPSNKALIVTRLFFKETMRKWQAFIWLVFPIMITVMVCLANSEPIPGTGMHAFDYAFPGMVVYAGGMLVIRSATSFASGKKSGLLDRFDTLPIGRGNIFLGGVLSDTIFGALSIGVMFTLGYAALGVHVASAGALLVGFAIGMLFSIQSIGIGILIAAFAKTPEAASTVSMVIIMPMLFASGSFFIFESSIVYFMPAYWAKQVFFQLVTLGNGLGDPMYSSTLIGSGATAIAIPLWGGLLILVAFTVALLIAGIVTFQKKTAL